MENDKIKNNVNETEEKVETVKEEVKEENVNKVEVKKDEKNLEEPKGNSYAFLIIVFILLIAAVIVMPMILNR